MRTKNSFSVIYAFFSALCIGAIMLNFRIIIEIYKTEGGLQSVSVLEKMLEEMDSQYEKIRKMTYDTVEIQGIETYQILYHELMVRTSEALD